MGDNYEKVTIHHLSRFSCYLLLIPGVSDKERIIHIDSINCFILFDSRSGNCLISAQFVNKLNILLYFVGLCSINMN